MNLLDTPIVTTTAPVGSGTIRRTLPETLAGLASGGIRDFPRLRPHQRHVWHALLCQLAVLAMREAGLAEPPTAAEVWRAALPALTPKDPDGAAWSLVSPSDRPAFLQPPIPGGDLSEFKTVETPDTLDMLVMSKNHDLKAGTLPADDPELWLYALVSLQTQEGFLGAGNFGISRMNGGFASRPALAVGPDGDASARFRRDVARMNAVKDDIAVRFCHRTTGGLSLVWLEPWDGASSLPLSSLDAYYIEICRRVRLERRGAALLARAAGSKGTRIEAKAANGVTGDPWTPVITTKEGAKALTVDARGWPYRQLVRLLFPRAGDKKEVITAAPLQTVTADDASTDLAFLARALVRGQGKTEGFFERRIPVSKTMRSILGAGRPTDAAAAIAHERVGDAGKFASKVLFPAVMSVLAGAPDTDAGERARDDDKTKDRARARLDGFDQQVDTFFFEDLDRELAAIGDDVERRAARARWIRDRLKPLGRDVLDEAIASAMSPGATREWRIRVAAHDLFDACFHKQFGDQIAEALGRPANEAEEETIHG